MNEYSQPPAGKIAVHGNGFGVASPDQIEQRAREIALIDERNPDEYTDGDWDQAARELSGAADHNPPEETQATETMENDWEVTPNDHGHRAPRAGVDDSEETLGEQLVSGGVDEATHDQMLEARREELEEEGGTT